MKLLLFSFFAVSGTCLASSLAPVIYRDGTLVSTPTTTHCSAASETACENDDEFLVRSEGILYSLTPLSAAGRATVVLGRGFKTDSSLEHQPPGTQLKVRDDGKHFFVRVGNRESMYLAVEAR